jgi:hypothetical protein
MEVASEPIDVTNFSSSGYAESEAGILSANITCSGPYDGSSGATVGNAVTFILKYDTAGAGFTVSGRVTNVSVTQNVRGVAQVNITAQSTGSFTVAP